MTSSHAKALFKALLSRMTISGGVFTELAADAFQKTFNLAKRPVPIDVGKISTNLVWQSTKDKDPRHVWLRNQIKAVYDGL